MSAQKGFSLYLALFFGPNGFSLFMHDFNFGFNDLIQLYVYLINLAAITIARRMYLFCPLRSGSGFVKFHAATMRLVNEMSERKKLQNKWLQQQTNKTINVINEMKKSKQRAKRAKYVVMARTNNTIFPSINFINETIFGNSCKIDARDNISRSLALPLLPFPFFKWK